MKPLSNMFNLKLDLKMSAPKCAQLNGCIIKEKFFTFIAHFSMIRWSHIQLLRMHLVTKRNKGLSEFAKVDQVVEVCIISFEPKRQLLTGGVDTNRC